MRESPRPGKPEDPTEAILALCREISACQESLLEETGRSRSHLQAGADLEEMKPAILGQAEGAGRLQSLVESLGKGLRERPIPPGRLEEVQKAVEEIRVCLAKLADHTGEAFALASRKGVRIPGVGGRPYPRKRP